MGGGGAGVGAGHAANGAGGPQSATASEASSSWEAVDEKESQPTLWVPDHAAQTCSRCHTAFWFGRRKHHCRCCGQVVCGECSQNSAPIPSEQLYHPVRVCDGCFGTSNYPRGESTQLSPPPANADNGSLAADLASCSKENKRDEANTAAVDKTVNVPVKDEASVIVE